MLLHMLWERKDELHHQKPVFLILTVFDIKWLQPCLDLYLGNFGNKNIFLFFLIFLFYFFANAEINLYHVSFQNFFSGTEL